MDLIAAIATGASAAAIGIVRISGDGAAAACDRVFRPAAGAPLSRRPCRAMIYGEMLDETGAVIDRGLAVWFPAGGSYTGEESAEFHCHGAPVVLHTLLCAFFAAGARQARAGEFTRRAFLNGRLDLTQAEAVVDLIDAESAASARNAAAQLGGALRRDFEAVTDTLLEVSARFYAVVDYPDEDIADLDPAALCAALSEADGTLSRLLDTCRRGRVLRSGVRTAIVGRPNAGKSSLLNALAGYDRAIVTAVPGTTRDTVEESVLCGGVLMRLVDTAGIRRTEDAVEKLGVERSLAALHSADLNLVLWDGSHSVVDEDVELLRRAMELAPTILVWTKTDLLTAPTPFLNLDPLPPVVELSALTGQGLPALESAVAELFPAGGAAEGEILTNPRQQEAAGRARDAVRRGRAALAAGMTPDAVLSDVEEALDALGELTGKTARQEIVSRIFERFCVGK